MFETFDHLPEEIKEALIKEMEIQTKGLFSAHETMLDYDTGGELFQFGSTSSIYGESSTKRFGFWVDVLIRNEYDKFYEIQGEKVIEIEQQGQKFMI